MLENNETIGEELENNQEKPKPLFTKGRIYFLIGVFIIFLFPLVFRYLATHL